jgi:hypothetical protein
MANEQLKGEVPEDIKRLVRSIQTACRGELLDDVIEALWLTLLGAIIEAEGCSIPEAVESMRNDLNGMIAANSPRH